jgi:lauroyl/myristoyl acyltransferase
VPDRLVLLKCREALRAGHVVCIYIEASASDVPPRTVLPFLGHAVKSPEGPALIASLTERPLIPALILHQPGYRFRIVLDEPIRVGRETGGIEAGLRVLWARLESWVKQYPEQWVGWEFFSQQMCAEVAGAEREARR